MVSAPAPGGARAVARCDHLGGGPYSETPEGLYRPYLSRAHHAALATVRGWMAEAGMSVRRDPAMNLIGRYEGTRRDAAALLVGSHIDSVRDGGRYDGTLGVMLGIELVAALAAHDRRLPFAVEVIAFGDEEGSRFPVAMLGSRAVAGTLTAEHLQVIDADGMSLADAGLDLPALSRAARMPQSVVAFLEPHIEQGPVLEAEGLAVGTVTGIAAQQRVRLQVGGRAGHAGTSAMALRADALAGAAEMILAAEQAARGDGGDLVATVGTLAVEPGSTNVVPGKVSFTLDMRSGDPHRLASAVAELLAGMAGIAARRGLTFTAEPYYELPASPCDAGLMDLLDAAIADCGLPGRRLVSGAGHDAASLAALCPTAMLFIRCRGGISHNPAEHVDPHDADLALAVMLRFTERLGARLGQH